MNVFLTILESSLSNGLIWAVLALGVYIAFRVLDIADLSVEGLFPLGGSLVILFINYNLHPLLSILLAVLIGAAFGGINGLLTTKLKIPALLSGIIIMVAVIPLCLWINGFSSSEGGFIASAALKNDKNTIYDTFDGLIKQPWGQILMSLIILVLFGCAIYLFFGTKLGMAIRAAGKNKTMAKAQGINTDLMVILGLMISSAIIALSGALFAQAEIGANADSGRGAIVIALTVIFIGEAIFGKRSFWLAIISVGVGSFLYYIVISLIQQFLDTNLLKLFQAIILVLILCIPLLKGGFKDFKKKYLSRKES